MMKRISLLILLAGLSYGQVTNVIATKAVAPFWVVPSGTMPFDLWTNSVLWLTAESPVLNAGTTNANWICYAKTCSGNLTQLDPNKQPLRVLTNGVLALRFDGTDDILTSPSNTNLVGAKNFTVALWVDFAGQWPSGSAIAYLCSVFQTNGNQRAWALELRGPDAAVRSDVVVFRTSGDGSGVAGTATVPYIPKSSLTNGMTHIVANVRAGRYITLLADGEPSLEANIPMYASSAPFTIGSAYDVPSFSAFNLADIKAFGYALGTNGVLDLYNAEKARYGK